MGEGDQVREDQAGVRPGLHKQALADMALLLACISRLA
jgi:hypothetical protein